MSEEEDINLYLLTRSVDGGSVNQELRASDVVLVNEDQCMYSAFKPAHFNDFEPRAKYGVIEGETIKFIRILKMAENKEDLSFGRAIIPKRWSTGPTSAPLKNFKLVEEGVAAKITSMHKSSKARKRQNSSANDKKKRKKRRSTSSGPCGLRDEVNVNVKDVRVHDKSVKKNLGIVKKIIRQDMIVEKQGSEVKNDVNTNMKPGNDKDRTDSMTENRSGVKKNVNTEKLSHNDKDGTVDVMQNNCSEVKNNTEKKRDKGRGKDRNGDTNDTSKLESSLQKSEKHSDKLKEKDRTGEKIVEKDGSKVENNFEKTEQKKSDKEEDGIKGEGSGENSDKHNIEIGYKQLDEVKCLNCAMKDEEIHRLKDKIKDFEKGHNGDISNRKMLECLEAKLEEANRRYVHSKEFLANENYLVKKDSADQTLILSPTEVYCGNGLVVAKDDLHDAARGTTFGRRVARVLDCLYPKTVHQHFLSGMCARAPPGLKIYQITESEVKAIKKILKLMPGWDNIPKCPDINTTEVAKSIKYYTSQCLTKYLNKGATGNNMKKIRQKKYKSSSSESEEDKSVNKKQRRKKQRKYVSSSSEAEDKVETVNKEKRREKSSGSSSEEDDNVKTVNKEKRREKSSGSSSEEDDNVKTVNKEKRREKSSESSSEEDDAKTSRGDKRKSSTYSQDIDIVSLCPSPKRAHNVSEEKEIESEGGSSGDESE